MAFGIIVGRTLQSASRYGRNGCPRRPKLGVGRHYTVHTLQTVFFVQIFNVRPIFYMNIDKNLLASWGEVPAP